MRRRHIRSVDSSPADHHASIHLKRLQTYINLPSKQGATLSLMFCDSRVGPLRCCARQGRARPSKRLDPHSGGSRRPWGIAGRALRFAAIRINRKVEKGRSAGGWMPDDLTCVGCRSASRRTVRLQQNRIEEIAYQLSECTLRLESCHGCAVASDRIEAAREIVIDQHRPGRGMCAEMPRCRFTFSDSGLCSGRLQAGTTSTRRSREAALANNSKDARDRANSTFKKQEQRAREGAKAMADYEAEGRAMRERQPG